MDKVNWISVIPVVNFLRSSKKRSRYSMFSSCAVASTNVLNFIRRKLTPIFFLYTSFACLLISSSDFASTFASPKPTWALALDDRTCLSPTITRRSPSCIFLTQDIPNEGPQTNRVKLTAKSDNISLTSLHVGEVYVNSEPLVVILDRVVQADVELVVLDSAPGQYRVLYGLSQAGQFFRS